MHELYSRELGVCGWLSESEDSLQGGLMFCESKKVYEN